MAERVRLAAEAAEAERVRRQQQDEAERVRRQQEAEPYRKPVEAAEADRVRRRQQEAEAEVRQRWRVVANSTSTGFGLRKVEEALSPDLHAVGKEGTRAECEATLRALWTDLFPMAFRCARAQAARESAKNDAPRYLQAAKEAVLRLAGDALAAEVVKWFLAGHPPDRPSAASLAEEALRRTLEATYNQNLVSQASAEAPNLKKVAESPPQIVGTIRLHAGRMSDPYWLPCDGRFLPIRAYPQLYAVLGNAFGRVGMDLFALPDLRGRVPVMKGLREKRWESSSRPEPMPSIPCGHSANWP